MEAAAGDGAGLGRSAGGGRWRDGGAVEPSKHVTWIFVLLWTAAAARTRPWLSSQLAAAGCRVQPPSRLVLCSGHLHQADILL